MKPDPLKPSNENVSLGAPWHDKGFKNRCEAAYENDGENAEYIA